MKIALITGGGSGLGAVYLKSIQRRYPKLDEYWILDIQEEKLKKIAKTDPKIRPVVMNLADGESFSYLDKLLQLPDYIFGVAFASMATAIFLFSPFWNRMADRIDPTEC
ncbi:MAG: hypothetical protein J6S49_10845 [Erysipelotrichaceae bacterium]|nr:hypothetical protein [Erysipelotrichaceae bacterium]